MGNYKSKKVKKQETDVSKLASEILSSDESSGINEDDVPEVPEIIEEVKNTEKIPGKQAEVQSTPERINIFQGITPSTAFIVEKRIDEVQAILCRLFGSRNGDFFIINENTSTTYKNGQRLRYQGILVEDKNGFRYNLWFNLTKLGSVY
jgi:hypothetical protein